MPKNDLESANFANCEEDVVHNFSNAFFQYMQPWFDTQLDQKILDGL